MDKTGACTVIAAIATVARLAPGHAAAGRRAGGREHARPALDPARRHRQGDERQVGRHHQHRRRGPADPGRRDDLRGAAGRHAPRRRRDADRCRRARVRPHRHRRVRRRRTRGATTSTRRRDRAGERYWRIPLIEDYMAEMDSWYGDIQNSGTAEGSLVKSGLFLEQFATVPWVHLDIGGTGVLPQDAPVRAARRDRRDPRHARRARAGGGPDGPRRARAADRDVPIDPLALGARASRAAACGASSPTASPPAGRSTRTASSGAIDWRTPWSWSWAARRARRRCPAASRSRSRCWSSAATSVALILLLATDLDQRLLPDELTLPAIPIALIVAVAGLNPLVPRATCRSRSASRIGIPAGPFAARRSRSARAPSGMGDLKLLISAGLLAGRLRTFVGVVVGRVPGRAS